jgi:hypothetical protein
MDEKKPVAREKGRMNTRQKLEVLQETCADAVELGQVVEKLLDLTLGRHRQRLARYEQDLRAFETQHAMDSETFYQRFEAGELGDSMDFFEWAGLYELHQDLLQKINRIEAIL